MRARTARVSLQSLNQKCVRLDAVIIKLFPLNNDEHQSFVIIIANKNLLNILMMFWVNNFHLSVSCSPVHQLIVSSYNMIILILLTVTVQCDVLLYVFIITSLAIQIYFSLVPSSMSSFAMKRNYAMLMKVLNGCNMHILSILYGALKFVWWIWDAMWTLFVNSAKSEEIWIVEHEHTTVCRYIHTIIINMTGAWERFTKRKWSII